MRRFEDGLSGYTYLEEEPPMGLQITNGAHGLTALPAGAIAPGLVPPATSRRRARSSSS
jgi:hypothetical protein